MVQFNAEQENALSLLGDFFEGGLSDCLITGTAGTGKTFTVTHALQNLGSYPFSATAACAPTHKAKGVMQDYLASLGLNLPVFTIHSLLGLGADIDENGRRSFSGIKNTNAPIEQFDYVWVDECSMIGKELFEKLKNSNAHLLFTGDKYQLLPVGEEIFPVFEYFSEAKSLVAELKTPERYKGDIADYVYSALGAVKKKQLFSSFDNCPFSETCGYVGNWFDKWKGGDIHDSVVLTFTNADVALANQRCRDYVYGINSPDYITGEQLIAYRPVKSNTGTALLNNGDIVTIKSAEPSVFVHGNNAFKSWVLELDEATEAVEVISKQDSKAWEDYLEGIKGQCKKGARRWYEYYAAQDVLADLRPTWALTIHKSQGSGWPKVYFLDTFGYLKDRALQPRLHYVGASRAKEHLFVSQRL